MTRPDASDVGLDLGFFKSTDGVFKVVQLVLSILLLIFVLETQFWFTAQYVGFSMFVAIFNVSTLLLSVVIYLFKLYNGLLLDRLPWKNTELYYATGSSVLDFISMIVAAVASANNPPNLHYATSSVLSAFLMLAFVIYAHVIQRGGIPRSAVEDY